MPDSNHADCILKLLAERRFLRAGDLEKLGIPRVYLTRLVRRGAVRRIARGLYELAGAPADERATLAEVCARLPGSVVCLLSAAQFFELTTASPHSVWVTLPPGTPRPAVDFVELEVVYVKPTLLDPDDVELHDYFGATIRVTSAARTVADLFRFRSRVGLELAVQALQEYVASGRSIALLMERANRLRVGRVIEPFVQALM